MMRFVAVLASLAFLAACSPGSNGVVSHLEQDPQRLSDWGLFDVSSGALELAEGVVPYDLNSPLFTDYAHKLRTIWVPEGAGAAPVNVGGVPDLPIGTVISKTFYYPKAADAEDTVLQTEDPLGRLNPVLEDLDGVRLIETRLLVRRAQGWEPVSYVWNAEQTDAVLTRIGDVQPLSLLRDDSQKTEFAYIVPDINQCTGCHAPNNTSREIQPLGMRARHLNKAYTHDGSEVNQLTHLADLGILDLTDRGADLPANADWLDGEQPISARARAYLDINCSHCHNPVGPADTSGLDLTMDAEIGPALGICKLPIAAGSGTGGRAFSIVPGAPEESILVYRLETTKPGAMMPELGRALSHAEGVALIRQWIAEMDGACST
nr:SO2930 family diheme c-type cytochrome [Hyphomonas sp. Mor2]